MSATTFALLTVVATLALLVGGGLGVVAGLRLAERSRVELRREVQALSAQAVTESSRQVFAMADSRVAATEQVVQPVRESLERLNDRLVDLERARSSWQAQLRQQVESVQQTGDGLRQETRALAEALRRPQVRGSWGELQLRRSLELAGLADRSTFAEQVHRSTDDGVLRPDVVIALTGGKQVVVDAKVPLDAFLTATHASDPVGRGEALRQHVRQVRGHVDALGAKAYWRQFEATPEFVVMFLPAEAIFAQALETDPGLIEYAARKQVMLATPTTLIAMLRTIAFAWDQESVAHNAAEVHQLGRELYERLSTVAGHLDALGRSISGSVTAYNKTVGSLESRVLVSARRFRDLRVSSDALAPPGSLDQVPRPLTAPELVAPPEEPVVEGAPGREQWRPRAANDG
jgi:DNA recombination protein RmuC